MRLKLCQMAVFCFFENGSHFKLPLKQQSYKGKIMTYGKV